MHAQTGAGQADGGELIIYAPHISEVAWPTARCCTRSATTPRLFLKQWDKFDGSGRAGAFDPRLWPGTYENGIETPRVRVTLATGIAPDVCRRINLGYRDPKTVRVDTREPRDEGFVGAEGGEMLFC